MRSPRFISKKNSNVLILGLWLLAMGSTFNSCSQVKFAEAQKASQNAPQGDNTGQDQDQTPDPGTDPCLSNCQVHDHIDKITAPYASGKIDILLVVDNSVSMTEENAELSQRLNGMVNILEDAGASWQMCYTTTHVQDNSDAGKIREWKMKSGSSVVSTGSKVLSNATSNKDDVFKTTMANVELGQGPDGSGNEQGIAATRIAVDLSANSSCFRNDAAFSVLYLSDEDEASCGGRCANGSEEPDLAYWAKGYYTAAYTPLSTFNSYTTLINRVSSKWPNKAFTAHAIVVKPGDKACWDYQDWAAPAFYGVEYKKLQSATGGILGDICANSYSGQLTNIAQRTLESMGSVTLKCVPLGDPIVSFSPNPGSVSVTRSGNKVFFNPGLPSGTEVTLKYTCVQ